MFHVKRCVGIKSFSDAKWMKKRAAGKIKSFLIQQFFKNVGEVWASSPHLRSKSDFQIKLQQKSRRKSKESQLPFQSRGCNENTRFQGQLRFPGKLGMCPSLAEPYASGFPKTSRRQPKVFWSNNFSKMLARFRASSPDRCPQAVKSLCHPFGTRSGWWEKRQLFEAGRTRPLRLVKP